MPTAKTPRLSPEVENRIAEIETMTTLQQVQGVLTRNMSDILAGRVTANEGNAMSSAANKRMQAIQRTILSR